MKAYEWALDAMKVVSQVKSVSSSDEVTLAAEAINELLQENPPPVTDETFSVIIEMAERLNNNTLLQQCKVRMDEFIAQLNYD